MHLKWLFVGLLVGGSGWTACGADEPSKEPKPPEGWVEYTPKDKIFNVWVPKGGKRTERADWVDVKDQKVRVNILELESDGKGKFLARTILLSPRPVKGKIGPKTNPFPDPQALTEAARDAFLKEVKGKVADENEVKIGDRKGKEYSITVDTKTSARLRVLVIGSFLYQVGIVGTKEQVGGKDADTFLDSFKPTLGEKK